MKNKTPSPTFPTVSPAEVQHTFPKTEAILLRLSVADKEAITSTAKALHLTATEYLVKCHEVVSAKVGESG
jgi:hypothetical protein